MSTSTVTSPAATVTAPANGDAVRLVGDEFTPAFTLQDFDNYKFKPIRESQVNREMASRYMNDMLDYAETDVIIVGCGSAGLSCAWELTRIPMSRSPLLNKTCLLVVAAGWVVRYLFSAMIVRKPADVFLRDVGVPYDDASDNYVVVKHAALFTSTIMSKLLARPNVKLFNATAVEDLIVKDKKVAGVVTNWSLVTQAHDTQSCMDPNVMECKVVVSGCGHDGPMGASGVKRLESIGLVKPLKGMHCLDMNRAEDGKHIVYWEYYF
ncbi:unnamed protein product [Absidia cylindrospora]